MRPRLSSAQRRNLALIGPRLQPGQPVEPGFYWIQFAGSPVLHDVQVYRNPGGYLGYPNPSGLWVYQGSPNGDADRTLDAPLDHCSVVAWAPCPGPRFVCSGAFVGRHPGGQATAMCLFFCESEEEAWAHFEATSHAVDEACATCDLSGLAGAPAWHYAIPA